MLLNKAAASQSFLPALSKYLSRYFLRCGRPFATAAAPPPSADSLQMSVLIYYLHMYKNPKETRNDIQYYIIVAILPF